MTKLRGSTLSWTHEVFLIPWYLMHKFDRFLIAKQNFRQRKINLQKTFTQKKIFAKKINFRHKKSCQKLSLQKNQKKKIFAKKKNVLPPQPQPRMIGRFQNPKSLIFFRSQAGLYGAHKKSHSSYLKIRKHPFSYWKCPLKGRISKFPNMLITFFLSDFSKNWAHFLKQTFHFLSESIFNFLVFEN